MDKDRDTASGLVEKLNEEGKEMAIEYISYLVMSGKYSAVNNCRDVRTHIPDTLPMAYKQ